MLIGERTAVQASDVKMTDTHEVRNEDSKRMSSSHFLLLQCDCETGASKRQKTTNQSDMKKSQRAKKEEKKSAARRSGRYHRDEKEEEEKEDAPMECMLS